MNAQIRPVKAVSTPIQSNDREKVQSSAGSQMTATDGCSARKDGKVVQLVKHIYRLALQKQKTKVAFGGRHRRRGRRIQSSAGRKEKVGKVSLELDGMDCFSWTEGATQSIRWLNALISSFIIAQ